MEVKISRINIPEQTIEKRTDYVAEEIALHIYLNKNRITKFLTCGIKSLPGTVSQSEFVRRSELDAKFDLGPAASWKEGLLDVGAQCLARDQFDPIILIPVAGAGILNQPPFVEWFTRADHGAIWDGQIL